jgi:hypothetical protein
MDSFRRDDLRSLLDHKTGPCVSLFMHTTRGPGHQDKIQWKNVVREAEERLKASGVRTPEARNLIQPAADLLNDEPFWLDMPIGGLAGFLAPGLNRFFRVDIDPGNAVVVGPHFDVKPLLPLLTDNGRFFVLTLSQKKVRFFHGTRDHLTEVALVNVPESLDEALFNTDEGETRSRIEHPATDPRSDRQKAIFRGPGTGTESGKDGLLEYCHRVDRGLQKYLNDEQAPLVLATIEYLQPHYKQANTYQYLLEDFIPGSPDGLSETELRQRAWALVEKRIRAERERLFALYQQLDATGTGLAAHHLPQVVSAAYQGQIQYLLLPDGVQSWGRFNPGDLSVELHDQRQEGDEDLFSLAATFALQHKARVIALDRDALPGLTQPAAIFWLPLGDRSDSHVLPGNAAARV